MIPKIEVISPTYNDRVYDESSYYKDVEALVSSFLYENLSILNIQKISLMYKDIKYNYDCHNVTIMDEYTAMVDKLNGSIFLICKSELPHEIPEYLIKIF